MDKAKKYLILTLLTLGPLFTLAQELTFRDYESQSLELYKNNSWKELIRLGEAAVSDGIDYYYLRIRTGIACFETQRYVRALIHLKAALNYNEKDPVALEYLYASLLELNRTAEARETYRILPKSAQKKLKKTLPGKHSLNAGIGPVLSNQMENTEAIDLDGDDNIYGEADIVQEGYYLEWGIARELKNGHGLFGAYSLVKLDKNKLVTMGDTLSVDDQYTLKQHQFYLTGNINLGRNYYIRPAMNFILGHYKTVMPILAGDSTTYLFPVEEFSPTSFIGYLELTKDFNILRAGIFAAYSNLNQQDQFQIGFQTVVLPFGNLNFYLESKLLNHRNEGQDNLVFEQVAGVRLFKSLWTEVNATFGKMENYYDKHAYVVYNMTDQMNFKGGARVIITIGPRILVTGDYIYLSQEGEYSFDRKAGNNKAISVTKGLKFLKQIFLVGIKLKI